jgi:hypothetical protein
MRPLCSSPGIDADRRRTGRSPERTQTTNPFVAAAGTRGLGRATLAGVGDPPVIAAHCLNCDTPLPTPRPNYCPQCGQESTLRPPRLREFIQQFGGAFVSTEGALWRTLALLLTRPGELTRQYLAGRRKRYVLPLRLYLTTSVITLLLIRASALWLGEEPLQFDIGPGLAQQLPKEARLHLGIGEAGLRNGVFYCERLPAWLCRRIERRLDLDPKRLADESARLGQRILGNIGPAMFVLLPSFALFTLLAYRNRGLRYSEHLVFALHVHAFWFVAIAVTLLGLGVLSAVAVASIPVYTLLAMRRVYQGRVAPMLLRAAVISLLYSITLGIAIAGAAIVAILG